ncbi:succinyldiaminopimelate transaminase [Chrysiogenes arsenatis]|uniref:succinyldiaminopimelate transaminase n=1 Tax=Chrysiogenes arsenatis TaxID=309797 RepID=UPI0004854DAD|nr:succinyldiaminopimelate transaminase [Chrysiogenes arsenatis]
MNSRISALQPYPMDELNRLKAELQQQGVTLYDFGTGDPTIPTSDFIIQALRDAIPSVSQYPTVAGESTMRTACAGYLQRRFQVSCNPATEILPSAGSKESVFHFPLAFLDPHTPRKYVIYPTPGYAVYERGTLFAEGECYPVILRPENNFLLDLDAIPSDILRQTAIVWINYPHNPTGAIATAAYYQRVAELAREYGFIVCSDECYCDIYDHDDAAPLSMLQFGRENILAFYSLSKRSGMTGYRSGFMAGDSTLVATYKKIRTSMGVASPTFIQAAATAAWSDDAHVAWRRGIFGERKQLFLDFFARHGLECHSGPATFFLWVKAPAGYDGQSYATHLLRHGIVVSPGSFFGDGSAEYIRIALVPDKEKCQQAIALWEKL